MHTLSFVATAVFLLLVDTSAAVAQKLKPNREGQVTFVTPSGNIGCTFTPKGGTSFYEPMGGGPELVCERVNPTYITVRMGIEGPPQRIIDPGEQGCCALDQKLGYSHQWNEGPFTCLSKTSGLSCRSISGHGFSMSKASVRIW